MKTISAPRSLFLALVVLAGSGAAATESIVPAHLAALRLQGQVIFEKREGWTLEERMRALHVHGVSVAVCSGGAIDWAEAWGLADVEIGTPATPSTLFQAGSISKPVSAAAILRQVETGKLELDRDVNEFLSSWRLPGNELTAKSPVTLERLLSHGAGTTVHGFPGYAPGEPVPTVQQVLNGDPPANTSAVRVDLEPGTAMRYSGGGYTIAQLALTDTLGESFPAILARTVLAPAGMADSTFEQPLPPDLVGRAAAGYRRDGSAVPGKRHTYPEMAAAGLWTTASDLCRFAMSIQRSRVDGRGGVLGQAMAERMTTPFNQEFALGFYGEAVGDEFYFGHNGADEGFQAMLVANRGRGFAAAVMVNSDNGARLADEIVDGIARRSGWPDYLPAPLPEIPLTTAELRALPGRYRVSGDQAFELRRNGDEAELRTSPSDPWMALVQVAAGELARADRPTRYLFEADNGVVSTITVTNPAQGEQPAESVVSRRMRADEQLPSDWLDAGDDARALTAFRELHRADPGDDGVAEARLNRFGYELAARGDLDAARTVLALNTELYPASANTWDSLAEITLRGGDRAGALALYRRVLETLAGDASASEATRSQLRTNAEAKVRELTAE